MKKIELYNKTVGILVDAYMNDTLRHGSCIGCAVGNLICANMYNGDMNMFDKKLCGDDGTIWVDVIDYTREPRIKKYIGNAKAQIDSTGYSIMELANIELAFESSNKNKMYDDAAMFNGLMAVIDVLDIIHENTDIAITIIQKERFQKQLV